MGSSQKTLARKMFWNRTPNVKMKTENVEKSERWRMLCVQFPTPLYDVMSESTRHAHAIQRRHTGWNGKMSTLISEGKLMRVHNKERPAEKMTPKSTTYTKKLLLKLIEIGIYSRIMSNWGEDRGNKAPPALLGTVHTATLHDWSRNYNSMRRLLR